VSRSWRLAAMPAVPLETPARQAAVGRHRLRCRRRPPSSARRMRFSSIRYASASRSWRSNQPIKTANHIWRADMSIMARVCKISPIQENIFNRRKFVRPRNTTSSIYVCSDTAYCVRCCGEIDCSDPSLYPSPACRPLNCRLHLQRRSVRWTTAAHDARRICETKDGARRDPRSASRHRRYRHATASSPNVCSCSRH
jgi:hypothetical protein